MYIFFVLKHIYVHVSGPHNIFNVYFLPLKILPLEFPINESLLNVLLGDLQKFVHFREI